MTDDSYDKRICGDFTDNVSYWLVAPEDYTKKCHNNGDEDPSCSPFSVGPGYEQLDYRQVENGTHGITDKDIVTG